jgi:hypothetical protein
VLILTKKIGWATFWVTFSQTHLATLVPLPASTHGQMMIARAVYTSHSLKADNPPTLCETISLIKNFFLHFFI